MTRDEQEMALWRETYGWSRLTARDGREAEADAAVAAFRKRYPATPAADDRLGRAAIEAMDAILGVMGDERYDEFTLSAIDRIATQYVAARWHIEKETGK